MLVEEDEVKAQGAEGLVPLHPAAEPSLAVKDGAQQSGTPLGTGSDNTPDDAAHGTATGEVKQLSKTALKKLRKKEEWEAGRAERKVLRKEKVKGRKERKREAYREEQERLAVEGETNEDGTEAHTPATVAPKEPRKTHNATQLPITFIFDCQFDDLMKDGELISLAGQLTRCYSDNKKSTLRAHLAISSFNGKLKNRFETVLANHHLGWKNVRFLEEDFVGAAEQAKVWMAAPRGGNIAGALKKTTESEDGDDAGSDKAAAETGEIVYLSSDSPDTLTELKPYSTYIIGGLVDRNRHKGICYKKAKEQNIRTARLPIGEFIEMASRAVLATNHVNEIMLKWLQLDDWGKAFFQVIPKRKGGKLRDRDDDGDTPSNGGHEEDEHMDDEEEPAASTAIGEVKEPVAATAGEEVQEPAATTAVEEVQEPATTTAVEEVHENLHGVGETTAATKRKLENEEDMEQRKRQQG